MYTVFPKTNKKNKKVKIFLAIFIFVFLFVGLFGINASNAQAADNTTSKTTVPANAQEVDEFSCSAQSWASKPLICIAQSLLGFLSVLVSLAVTLFGWAINPDRMTAIISSDSVYLGWKNVRDFLNITFILFLLFSAFCTIFQISKYSYKSILLNLVLMALLVNFSFPITRFIIDVSNVLAYTLLSALFPGGIDNLSGNLAGIANLGEIINPGNANLVPLIIADIFLFIFGVTFLILALLFIIRIIALAILIIFSPVAFTGSLIPGLQDKASKWWTELFNYSFFAPIMIFMLYIATGLAGSMSTELGKTISKLASNNSTEPSWLANLCSFIIPVVILWIGMGIAKGMSIAGAGAITDFAQKAIKNTPKMLGKGAMWGFNKTGVPGAAKQRWDQSWLSKKSSDARLAAREARLGSKIGVKGALEKDMKTRAEEYKKNNISVDELSQRAAKGDAAAAYRLALDGDMDAATYAKIQLNVKDNVLRDKIEDKTREKNAEAIVRYKVNKATTFAEKRRAAKEEYGKLTMDDWKKQKNISKVIDRTDPDFDPIVAAGAQNSFNNLHKDAKKDIGKSASGNTLSKMRGAGFRVP